MITAHENGETIETRVARIIANQFGGFKLTEIEPDMKLKDDLAADSLDEIEIVMALEEQFGRQIADDDCIACTTVGELQQLMVKLVGESA